MPEPGETKVCPLCAETIKAAAKVCPHCRKVQGRFFFMSRYDILAVCAVVAITGITIVVVEIFGHSREYSPQQHKIVVLQSQFALEKDGDHTNVVVSGVLTNASDYTWNLTRFEVRFLDAAGKTVDARQAGDDYMNLTVLAHGDRSFKLNLYLRAVPNHASSRITVTEARQPGFWYNND